MIVLVDYDNVRPIDRQRGSTYVVERVVRTFSSNMLNDGDRIHVKLYGGWYEESRLSRSAQQLVPRIQADFPRPIIVGDAANPKRVIVQTELAYALECEPGTVLTHTFRSRNPQPNLRCIGVPFQGCASMANCPMAAIDALISSGQCTALNCGVTPGNVLYRAEQKLVDTMLVSDLIYFASTKKSHLAIVSSDDDLWPGIISAARLGAQIHHVHTSGIPQRQPTYRRAVTSGYYEYSL